MYHFRILFHHVSSCLLEVLHRRAYIWYGLGIVWRFGAQGSDIKDTKGIEKFSGIIVY